MLKRYAGPAALAALAALAGLAACSAPQSVRAGGPVGEQVRASIASGKERFDHDAWGRLLREGTREGLVDYAFLRDRKDALDGYLERLAAARLASLSGSHLEALLINAYNALTVRSILENPGVSSIREIDGVWREESHRVGGFDLTLDQIEHNLLRPYFKDPRIHFALNCASVSCAPLPGWAYDGDRLEAQLEERTRSFLSDPDNVRVEGSALVVSRYFDWFATDFTSEGWSPRAGTIPGFIAMYSRDEIVRFVREAGGEPPLRFMDYDWSLNSAP